MRRGFSLPGVMGGCLLLFVLFLAFRNGLDQQRERISADKHRQAAFWLATSGADLAEVRLRKGTLGAGETLLSPALQQGSFVVRAELLNDRTSIVSEGRAGNQTYLLRREVPTR